MDPLTLALLSATTGAIQAGMEVTANDRAQRENRKALGVATVRKRKGEYLTPEEEQAINLAVVAPGAQQAAEARRRAEQIRHGALANRGGSSGAALANLAQGELVARTRAQERGAAALAQGRMQGRRDLEQEISDRQGLRESMRQDDYGTLINAIPAIMSSVGELEGQVPGSLQAAAPGGRPMRRQVDWENELAKFDEMRAKAAAAQKIAQQLTTPTSPAPTPQTPSSVGPPVAPAPSPPTPAQPNTRPPLPQNEPAALVNPRAAREVATKAQLHPESIAAANSWLEPLTRDPRLFWAMVEQTPSLSKSLIAQGQIPDYLEVPPAAQQALQGLGYMAALQPYEQLYIEELTSELAVNPSWYYYWADFYPRMKDKIRTLPWNAPIPQDELENYITLADPSALPSQQTTTATPQRKK